MLLVSAKIVFVICAYCYHVAPLMLLHAYYTNKRKENYGCVRLGN